MGIVAFVPAKMTSRRLPRKNMALLGGRPLIHYTLKTAEAVEEIDQIVVSSEADEVLNYARTFGAYTHKRQETPFGS